MRDYELREIDSVISSPNSLLFFYADWCPFCKSFKPKFEDSAEKLKNKKIVVGSVKLNEDENPLWDRFNIQAVPTLIAFSNNSIKDRRDAKMGVGLTSKDLESILSNIVTNP